VALGLWRKLHQFNNRSPPRSSTHASIQDLLIGRCTRLQIRLEHTGMVRNTSLARRRALPGRIHRLHSKRPSIIPQRRRPHNSPHSNDRSVLLATLPLREPDSTHYSTLPNIPKDTNPLGIPPALAAYSLAYTLGLMGIISPYATGPVPVYYGSGYIKGSDYWKLGLIFGIIYFIASPPRTTHPNAYTQINPKIKPLFLTNSLHN